jgi:hypothetical protein
MSNLEQKVIDLMLTQEAKDVKTLLAFAVLKTKTLTDDEIVENIDEIVSLVAENIKDVAEQKPTDQEAKDAAFRILKSVAAKTKTPWDDRVIKIIDMFI